MFEYIVQFMLKFFKENNRHSSNNIIFYFTGLCTDFNSRFQSKIAPNAKMLPILYRGLYSKLDQLQCTIKEKW